MELSYYSKEIQELIKSSGSIAVSAHTAPDGDAAGSCMAVALWLSLMGKKPVIYIEPFSSKMDFLKGREFISDNFDIREYDLFISLDCADKKRLSEAEKIFDRAKKTLVIDHHVSNEYYGDYNIVKGGLSSTCEIVYEIIKNANNKINYDIAEALYVGILTDTGGFKHNCTTSRTYEIAAELIKFGLKTERIQETVLYSHTAAESRALARAIENMDIYDDIVITSLTKDEIINKCGADYKQIGHISNYMISHSFAKAAAFIYENEDGSLKISMRSKGLDVNRIASKYGGGGHIQAAAAVVRLGMDEAKKKILNDFRNGLQNE